MRAWASDGGWRRAVRLVNRALKMMGKVVLGLGHMWGCAGSIWGRGGVHLTSFSLELLVLHSETYFL